MSNVIRGLGAYERDQLIKRYIALLDAIEHHHLKEGDRDAELELISEASSLMGSTLGEIGRISLEKPEDAPRATMTALMNWQSAFARNTDAFFWEEVASELMRLQFGDAPEMLKPAQRNQNQDPLAGRLWFMRLTAVGWREFFSKNHRKHIKVYEEEIAEAFRVEIETLKKWRGRTKKYFGADFFSSWLSYVNSGLGDALTSKEYREFLQMYGRKYQVLSGMIKKGDE